MTKNSLAVACLITGVALGAFASPLFAQTRRPTLQRWQIECETISGDRRRYERSVEMLRRRGREGFQLVTNDTSEYCFQRPVH